MRLPAACLVLSMLLTTTAVAACGGGDEKKEAAAEPAAEAPAEPAAPAAPAVPPGPAPVEGYDWTLNEMIDQPGRLALAYSVPETDDMPLSFVCQEGSGLVSAEVDSAVTGVGAIILRSGDSQGMYPVTNRVPSEMSGGEFLSAEIDVADPTMQAFKAAGWINLGVAGETRDLAAHPGAAPGQVSAFFDRCAASTDGEGSAAAPG